MDYTQPITPITPGQSEPGSNDPFEVINISTLF